MYRLGCLVRPSNYMKIANPIIGAAANIHFSSLRRQEHHEMSDAVDDSSLTEPKRSYFNQVTMIGDVASKPQALYREGNVFGYKLRIMSKKRFNGPDGQHREVNHYHNAVCNNKRCFPIFEKDLNVNDQVFIRGTLINVDLTNLEQNSFMTLIRVNTIHPFKR